MFKCIVLISCVYIVFCCSICVMCNSMQPLRKTCGSDLNDRVSRICEQRGGYYSTLKHSRSRRSIVKECCRNVCPDSNIYLYCSNQNALVESTQSDNDAVTSATNDYFLAIQKRQNDDAADVDLITEQSIVSSNSIFFKSRQYGTISPEFRKGAIYVMG